MSAITLHYCPSCNQILIGSDVDFCIECEPIVAMDLEIHTLITSLGRLREMPIEVLAKRKDLLLTIQGEISDMRLEIENIARQKTE